MFLVTSWVRVAQQGLCIIMYWRFDMFNLNIGLGVVSVIGFKAQHQEVRQPIKENSGRGQQKGVSVDS